MSFSAGRKNRTRTSSSDGPRPGSHRANRNPGEVRGVHRAPARGGRAQCRDGEPGTAGRSRLRSGEGAFGGSPAKAEPASPSHHRAGGADLRRHARGDFAAAGAPEARLQDPRAQTGMTPEDALRRGVAELGLELPQGAEARLMRYMALLEKWNRTYNLTAIRNPAEVVTHHLLDCLAMVSHALSGIANRRQVV